MKSFYFIRHYIIAFISLLILITVTILAYFEVRKRVAQRVENIFNIRVSLAENAIKTRMNDYIQILKGALALITASDTVTRKEWNEYIGALQIEKNYPGIQGIGYTVVLNEGNKDQLVRKLRSEGLGHFDILPPGKRKVYTSIIYLEPMDTRNLRAIGFDMFIEPVRRKAMERARDENQAALSGKVTLIQETSEHVQPGFLLYLPVYRNHNDPVTVNERRSQVSGYVYSPFRAVDLMTQLFSKEFPDIDVEIYDGDQIDKGKLLYDKDDRAGFFKEDKDNKLGRQVSFPIAGTVWTVFFAPLPHSGFTLDHSFSMIILIAGLIISLLVFLVMMFLAKVRSVNQLKQTITDNATSALFMLNPKGVCHFMNPAAERLTGYTLNEMKQKPLHQVIHYKHVTGEKFPGEDCLLYLAAVRMDMEITGHEDIFIRKDGSLFCATCALRPVFQNDIATGSLLEIRDITEEKKNKEAIIRQNKELKRINSDLDNFVYTASHDLKAPITNIEALVHVLEDEIRDNKLDSGVQDIIEYMNVSVNRFKETIQDLTDITKIQKNTVEDTAEINMNQLIDQVIQSISDLIATSNASVYKDLQVASVRFSKANLKSILYNLISNAVKYKDPARDPEITIRTYLSEGFFVVEVSDNGLGISKENLDKIFQMFKRLHDHVEGTGVGLYLVKRITDINGGKIEVDSKVGQGTIFRVYLRNIVLN